MVKQAFITRIHDLSSRLVPIFFAFYQNGFPFSFLLFILYSSCSFLYSGWYLQNSKMSVFFFSHGNLDLIRKVSSETDYRCSAVAAGVWWPHPLPSWNEQRLSTEEPLCGMCHIALPLGQGCSVTQGFRNWCHLAGETWGKLILGYFLFKDEMS